VLRSKQPVYSGDVLGSGWIHLLRLTARKPDRPVARRVGAIPAWSSAIAPAPSVFRIVSRATPSACSLATISMKSSAVSSSMRPDQLVELDPVLHRG
jgi:hypothetical protein